MIKVTPLSQRDVRWGFKKLGYSDLLIKDYGCTITALTVLLNSYGYNYGVDDVNNRLKANNGFVKALLWWAHIPNAFDEASMPIQYWIYHDNRVKEIINSGRPVMVKVDGSPIGAKFHWVLYVGDRKLMDPWTGKIESTIKYDPLRFVDIQVKSNNNMSDLQECLDQHTILVTELEACKKEIDTLTKTIAGKDSAITTAQRERDVARTEALNFEEEISRLRDQLTKVQRVQQALSVSNKELETELRKQAEVIKGLKTTIQELETANRELKKGAIDSISASELLRLSILKFLRIT